MIVPELVANLVATFRPQAAFYHNLKQALADYRRLQAEGGWTAVPAGDTLKPGMKAMESRNIAASPLAKLFAASAGPKLIAPSGPQCLSVFTKRRLSNSLAARRPPCPDSNA